MIISKILAAVLLLALAAYVVRRYDLDEKCGPSEECAGCPFPCEHHGNDQTGRGRTKKGNDL